MLLPNKDDIWKKVDAETKNEFIQSKYYLTGILKQKIVILFFKLFGHNGNGRSQWQGQWQVTMAMAGHNGNGRSQWQWQVTMAMAGHNGNGRSQWQWQVTMAMAGHNGNGRSIKVQYIHN